MDHIEQLRRLAINDARLADELICRSDVEVGSDLDQKTMALARIAALVGVGGPQPSFGALSDAAIDAGATAEEIVAVLVGVARVVGLPRVVASAPKVAIALGYDVDEDE